MNAKTKHATLLKDTYPAKRDCKIPKNRKEMLKSEFKDEFIVAEGIELSTLNHQKTITYVKDDPKAHKLNTRMIYDIKSDNEGNVIKFKARLVVLGYQQRPHQYGDTYASVAQWTTIVLMLVIGWLYAFDIHCNSFFVMFLLTHVLQYFLLPFLLTKTFFASLVANTLHFLGLILYLYITHLGYRSMSFLGKTELFLYPIGMLILFYLLLTILNLNMTRIVLWLYFS